MAILIDITDITDSALDVVLAAKADPSAAIVAEHLTTTERWQVARAMGWASGGRNEWDYTALVAWCGGYPDEHKTRAPGIDGERPDDAWERMLECTCNLGCNTCDPPPANWGSVEVINGPQATGH